MSPNEVGGLEKPAYIWAEADVRKSGESRRNVQSTSPAPLTPRTHRRRNRRACIVFSFTLVGLFVWMTYFGGALPSCHVIFNLLAPWWYALQSLAETARNYSSSLVEWCRQKRYQPMFPDNDSFWAPYSFLLGFIGTIAVFMFLRMFALLLCPSFEPSNGSKRASRNKRNSRPSGRDPRALMLADSEAFVYTIMTDEEEGEVSVPPSGRSKSDNAYCGELDYSRTPKSAPIGSTMVRNWFATGPSVTVLLTDQSHPAFQNPLLIKADGTVHV